MVTYISKVVNAEHGISRIGKGIHQQPCIIVEAMNVGIVEQNVSVSLSWMGTGYVGWCFFDDLHFSSRLASVEVS
jgi:hypothetical protein